MEGADGGPSYMFHSPHQWVPDGFPLIQAGKLLIWGQHASCFTIIRLASACLLQKSFPEADLEV